MLGFPVSKNSFNSYSKGTIPMFTDLRWASLENVDGGTNVIPEASTNGIMVRTGDIVEGIDIAFKEDRSRRLLLNQIECSVVYVREGGGVEEIARNMYTLVNGYNRENIDIQLYVDEPGWIDVYIRSVVSLIRECYVKTDVRIELTT